MTLADLLELIQQVAEVVLGIAADGFEWVRPYLRDGAQGVADFLEEGN